MGKAEISIIVPFLNAAGTLPRCIESICRQTYDRFELLLVDNGSTDDSSAIAERAAEGDQRIRLIRAAKRGVSAARNFGMKEAAGDYITFIDADDLVRTVYLERLYAMITESGSDFAAAGFESFADRESFDGTTDAQAGEKEALPAQLSYYDAAGYITDRILYSDNHVWGKLYRKEFLGRAGAAFEEGLTIGEDMLFLLHLTGTEMRAVCSDEKLYGYYVNPKGAIKRPFTENYFDQVRCWVLAEEWIGQHHASLLAGDGRSKARLSSIRVVAEMLVASKLALLPSEDRKAYNSRIREMQQDVREAVKDRKVVMELPAGYGAKTKLFSSSPAAYFVMYGALKARHLRRV